MKRFFLHLYFWRGIICLTLLSALSGLGARPADPAITVPVTTTIQAAINLAHDGDIVTIPAGTYTESLSVNKSLTLRGADAATTILQATPSHTAIVVSVGKNLTLEKMTVKGGNATGTTYTKGGGVFFADGNLTINNSIFDSNQAIYGGAIYQNSGTGTLTISGSTFKGNHATAMGGAIDMKGNLAVTSSLFQQNYVDTGNANNAYGGALHITNSAISRTVSVSTSTFSGNHLNCKGCQDTEGGAVYVIEGVSTSTVSFQQVNFNNNSGWSGGGIFGSRVTLTEVSFTNNYAGYGGGAEIWGGSVISKSSFMNNHGDGAGLIVDQGNFTPAPFILSDSVFSGNSGLDLNSSVIYINGPDATITNVAIVNSSLWVGSVLILSGGTSNLTFVTINGSTAGSNEGTSSAIKVPMNGHANITNSIIANNPKGLQAATGAVVNLDYTLWYQNAGGNTGGTGTINNLHAITGNPWFKKDGYHLTYASPAIDHGKVTSVTKDIDGDTRDAHPDIGADEFLGKPLFLPLIRK